MSKFRGLADFDGVYQEFRWSQASQKDFYSLFLWNSCIAVGAHPKLTSLCPQWRRDNSPELLNLSTRTKHESSALDSKMLPERKRFAPCGQRWEQAEMKRALKRERPSIRCVIILLRA